MSYSDYAEVNKEVSSEMFYSVMSVLYERLPCSQNFFRMKENYLQMMEKKKKQPREMSPANVIAYLNVMTKSVPGSPSTSPKSGSRKNSGSKSNLESFSNYHHKNNNIAVE